MTMGKLGVSSYRGSSDTVIQPSLFVLMSQREARTGPPDPVGYPKIFRIALLKPQSHRETKAIMTVTKIRTTQV